MCVHLQPEYLTISLDETDYLKKSAILPNPHISSTSSPKHKFKSGANIP